jgi:hypothetical protein
MNIYLLTRSICCSWCLGCWRDCSLAALVSGAPGSCAVRSGGVLIGRQRRLSLELLVTAEKTRMAVFLTRCSSNMRDNKSIPFVYRRRTLTTSASKQRDSMWNSEFITRPKNFPGNFDAAHRYSPKNKRHMFQLGFQVFPIFKEVWLLKLYHSN